MTDDHIDDMKKLVRGYLAGSATPEEEQEVLRYILASDDNEKQFREWEAEWEERPEVSTDTEEAWRQVETRMMDADNRDEEATRRSQMHVVWCVVRTAAAVVVLFVLGAVATLYYMSARPEQYYVSAAPVGSKSQVELPDGSKVWLNAGSSLKYSTRFGEKSRSVELCGEGYFEISKRGGNTFMVRTDGYDVVVRGTKFNVRAYRDEPIVSTTLFEGKVDISKENNQMLTLKPGETAIYNKVSKNLSKCVDCMGGNGWINGNIEFDNITFNELAAVLNRTFDVNIHTDSKKIGGMRLSVSLHNNETIDDVVDAIRLVGKVKVTRRGRDILVH